MTHAKASRPHDSVRVSVLKDRQHVTWRDSRGIVWDLWLTFTLDDRGLRCTRVEVGSADGRDDESTVDKAVLRELPLGEFTEQYGRRFARALRSSDEPVLEKLADEVDGEAPGPRARSTDFYREVVRVYREAQRSGRHPTKAVQEHFGGVARSTAATWVHRASKRWPDMLAPTTQGRPRALRAKERKR